MKRILKGFLCGILAIALTFIGIALSGYFAICFAIITVVITTLLILSKEFQAMLVKIAIAIPTFVIALFVGLIQNVIGALTRLFYPDNDSLNPAMSFANPILIIIFCVCFILGIVISVLVTFFIQKTEK